MTNLGTDPMMYKQLLELAGFAIGYRDIPQVSFTGNATIAAADAGKHFYSTESTNYEKLKDYQRAINEYKKGKLLVE